MLLLSIRPLGELACGLQLLLLLGLVSDLCLGLASWRVGIHLDGFGGSCLGIPGELGGSRPGAAARQSWGLGSRVFRLRQHLLKLCIRVGIVATTSLGIFLLERFLLL